MYIDIQIKQTSKVYILSIYLPAPAPNPPTLLADRGVDPFFGLGGGGGGKVRKIVKFSTRSARKVAV